MNTMGTYLAAISHQAGRGAGFIRIPRKIFVLKKIFALILHFEFYSYIILVLTFYNHILIALEKSNINISTDGRRVQDAPHRMEMALDTDDNDKEYVYHSLPPQRLPPKRKAHNLMAAIDSNQQNAQKH